MNKLAEVSEIAFSQDHRQNFILVAAIFLLGSLAALLMLAGIYGLAAMMVVAGLGTLLAMRLGWDRTLLLGLIALCLIPGSRVEGSILDADLRQLPSDPILRFAFLMVPGTRDYYPEALLAVFLVLIWIRFRPSFRRTVTEEPLLSPSIFAFIVAAVLSWATSNVPDVDFSRWARECIPIVTLAGFFPLANFLRREEHLVRFALWSVIAVLLVMTLHTLYAFFAMGMDLSVRATQFTPYNNLPYAGVVVVVMIPLVLFRPPHSRFTLGVWTILALSATVTILTKTRIFLASVPLAFGFIVFSGLRLGILRRQRINLFRILGLAGACCILFLALFSFTGEGFISRFTQTEDIDSAQWRIYEIQSAYKKFVSSPIYGTGLGTRFIIHSPRETLVWYYIHNAFFYYLANMGLMGVAPWFLIWIAVFANLWRKLRLVPERLVPYFLSFGGILIVCFSYNLFQSSFRTFQNTLLIVVSLAGLHACAYSGIASESGENPGRMEGPRCAELRAS